ncbi:MAG TPA: hypothetical protein VI278_15670 [Nitrososphaeraceae archaeon]
MEGLRSDSKSKSICICGKCKNAEVEIWSAIGNYCVKCWQEVTDSSPRQSIWSWDSSGK